MNVNLAISSTKRFNFYGTIHRSEIAAIKLLRTSSVKWLYLFVDEYSTDEVVSSEIIELVREDLRHLRRTDADLTV